MAISAKIHGFMSQSSWIRKMFEEGINLKKQYGAENVFDFSLGNPNVRPPGLFREKLLAVAGQDIPGMHGYMPNAGYPDTRAAVAAHLASSQGVPVTADHVIMTCGAGGALNVILKTVLNPGDEVVIPTPFFVEYRFYVDNAGGITKLVKSHADFSLDLEAMAEAVTEKTKVVLINSPNNPTGKVYNEASIKGLAALLTDKSAKYGREIISYRMNLTAFASAIKVCSAAPARPQPAHARTASIRPCLARTSETPASTEASSLTSMTIPCATLRRLAPITVHPRERSPWAHA